VEESATEPPTPESQADAEPTAQENGDAESTPEAEPQATFTEIPISEEFQFALDKISGHAARINTTIKIHRLSGIKRFRAAAQFVIDDIKDRRYRFSWDFLRRRRDFRKMYVTALSYKLQFDEATQLWETELLGADEAESRHELLQKEVPAIDKRLWTSLARWEYRKRVVHM
jgi:hypothetical protein